MHITSVPLWASVPFILILFCIAVIPLINRAWWDKYYPAVSIGLGVLTVAGYLKFLGWTPRVTHTSLDYFSFIVLLGALFVISGGILIRIEGRATPVVNAALLIVGAVVSNVIGTTGASMLLIRPYLRLNKTRMKPYLVVFFIFVVSNVGGALTPIGDPPLFLGYLKGVPFFWIIDHVWEAWLFALTLIIGTFLVFDFKNPKGEHFHADGKTKFVIMGWYNIIFLAAVIIAVFQQTPVREIIMMGAAALSYFLTPKTIHHGHEFNFHPIKEVAILFFGIFATMMPALDWLEHNAGMLGLSKPGDYYWASGVLSSFLDNAPTYLSFLSAQMGFLQMDVAGILARAPQYIVAISLGAVFFGAVTYIGNGPNFMVKSIAEHSRAHCPSFFGYMFKYSIPILIPIFTLVWLVFLR